MILTPISEAEADWIHFHFSFKLKKNYHLGLKILILSNYSCTFAIFVHVIIPSNAFTGFFFFFLIFFQNLKLK